MSKMSMYVMALDELEQKRLDGKVNCDCMKCKQDCKDTLCKEELSILDTFIGTNTIITTNLTRKKV